MELTQLFGGCYAGKRIVITGNTGFKGSWLSLWTAAIGAEVHGISNGLPSDPAMFQIMKLDERIHYLNIDIRDLETLKKAFVEIQPDFVFHLAAQAVVQASYDDPTGTVATNVLGTAHVLDCLRALLKPCVAVIITSDKCYENVEWTWGYRENDRVGGKDPYSASKGAAEIIISSYFRSFFDTPDSNVRIASARAGNVIGGGDWAVGRIVPDCVRAWSKRAAVEIRNPKATRPWQHVLEPLSGYLCLGQALYERRPSINGEAFNFGPNPENNFTVLELLTAIAEHWRFDRPVHAPFFVNSKSSFHEAGLLKLNCDKALHKLSWRSVLNFEQTALYTAYWYNELYNEGREDLWCLSMQQIEEYVREAKQSGREWARKA